MFGVAKVANAKAANSVLADAQPARMQNLNATNQIPPTPGDTLSSGEWMAAVLACVPRDLLAGPGAQRLIDWARALPDSVNENVFLLELALGEQQASADLSIWAVPHTAFGDYLVTQGEASDANPQSRGLCNYLKEVGHEGSFLARWLAYAMLEYDLTNNQENALPTPGVFLGSRINFPKQKAASDHSRWRHGNAGVMVAAICHAVGWEEVEQENHVFQRLCGLLPASAWSAQIGAMPQRTPRAIRSVIRMPAREVPSFLSRASWSGPFELVENLVEEIEMFDLKASLTFDVNHNGLLPRIGFELFIASRWKSPPQLWFPFLRRLRELGLCLGDKERALRDWPRRDLLFLQSGTRKLLSGINHIKLVIDGGSVSAKAYTMMKLLPVK